MKSFFYLYIGTEVLRVARLDRVAYISKKPPIYFVFLFRLFGFIGGREPGVAASDFLLIGVCATRAVCSSRISICSWQVHDTWTHAPQGVKTGPCRRLKN